MVIIHGIPRTNLATLESAKGTNMVSIARRKCRSPLYRKLSKEQHLYLPSSLPYFDIYRHTHQGSWNTTMIRSFPRDILENSRGTITLVNRHPRNHCVLVYTYHIPRSPGEVLKPFVLLASTHQERKLCVWTSVCSPIASTTSQSHVIMSSSVPTCLHFTGNGQYTNAFLINQYFRCMEHYQLGSWHRHPLRDNMYNEPRHRPTSRSVDTAQDARRKQPADQLTNDCSLAGTQYRRW